VHFFFLHLVVLNCELTFVVACRAVVESKSDDAPDDLRIYEPWDQLVKFAEGIKLEELDSHHHSHVPFIILLVKQLQKWRAEHGGKAPETRDEKALFKEQLRDGQVENEVNFEEAIAAAFKAWSPFSIPSEVQSVLDDPKARNPTADSSDFWLVVAAIARFADKHHVLPLLGAIPDMNADTNTYVALLQVYQEKVRPLSHHTHTHSPRHTSSMIADTAVNHGCVLCWLTTRRYLMRLRWPPSCASWPPRVPSATTTCVT
jgi:hypothetical protein